MHGREGAAHVLRVARVTSLTGSIQRSGGPTLGTEPLLTALGEAKATGNWALHRVGIVMLADVGLSLGMASTVRETLEECLPQVRWRNPAARD